tara:strand:- start:227 stop:832 length:606 start_codon:yes stop_codon:yes gene_type:complete
MTFVYDPDHYYLVSSKQSVVSLKKNFKKYRKLIKEGNFLVIGEKIKKELSLIGVRNILRSFTDSHELKKFLNKNKNIKCINHLTSNIPNEVLKKINETGDVKIIITLIYKTYFKKNLSYKLKRILLKKKITVMFHYSLKSSEIFMGKLSNQEKNFLRGYVTHLCISERVSEGIRKIMGSIKKIKVAKKPTQKDLMLLLDNT